VLLVVQPELPGITHASRFLDLGNELGYTRDKVILVVNGVLSKQGISPNDVSRALKRPSPLVIPDDALFTREAINRGEPIILGKAAGRPIGRAFNQVSQQLLVALETPPEDDFGMRPKKRGFLSRLLGRN